MFPRLNDLKTIASVELKHGWIQPIFLAVLSTVFLEGCILFNISVKCRRSFDLIELTCAQ